MLDDHHHNSSNSKSKHQQFRSLLKRPNSRSGSISGANDLIIQAPQNSNQFNHSAATLSMEKTLAQTLSLTQFDLTLQPSMKSKRNPFGNYNAYTNTKGLLTAGAANGTALQHKKSTNASSSQAASASNQNSDSPLQIASHRKPSNASPSEHQQPFTQTLPANNFFFPNSKNSNVNKRPLHFKLNEKSHWVQSTQQYYQLNTHLSSQNSSKKDSFRSSIGAAAAATTLSSPHLIESHNQHSPKQLQQILSANKRKQLLLPEKQTVLIPSQFKHLLTSSTVSSQATTITPLNLPKTEELQSHRSKDQQPTPSQSQQQQQLLDEINKLRAQTSSQQQRIEYLEQNNHSQKEYIKQQDSIIKRSSDTPYLIIDDNNNDTTVISNHNSITTATNAPPLNLLLPRPKNPSQIQFSRQLKQQQRASLGPTTIENTLSNIPFKSRISPRSNQFSTTTEGKTFSSIYSTLPSSEQTMPSQLPSKKDVKQLNANLEEQNQLQSSIMITKGKNNSTNSIHPHRNTMSPPENRSCSETTEQSAILVNSSTSIEKQLQSILCRMKKVLANKCKIANSQQPQQRQTKHHYRKE